MNFSIILFLIANAFDCKKSQNMIIYNRQVPESALKALFGE